MPQAIVDWTDVQQSSYHANNFCARCEQIIGASLIIGSFNKARRTFRTNLQEELFPFHTAVVLEASARRHCHLCSLLWRCLAAESWDRLQSLDTKRISCIQELIFHVIIRSHPRRNGTKGMDEATITLVNTDPSPAVLKFHPQGAIRDAIWECTKTVRVKHGEGNHPLIGTPQAYHLSSWTGSQAVLNLARQWLAQCLCLENHVARCHEFGEGVNERSLLPTRLLDITQGDGRVRLYLTDRTRDQGLQYLCLSHKWGDADIFRLTEETLPELQQGVAFNLLPRTFRDALHITMVLGYKFIWIDSLCIIQDSPEDWQREALTMASVYGNAVCTIAATQENSHSGCFRARNPLAMRPCRLRPCL